MARSVYSLSFHTIPGNSELDIQGHVTLRPEDDEDMWHLYNLIQKGDLVRAPAIR